MDVDLAYDSNGLAYGLYEANHKIATVNAYDNIEISVPINLRISGTSVEETIGSNCRIYPNPTNGQIKLEAEDLKHITINDMLGRTVYEGNVSGNEFIYDFAQHGDGIYLICIVTIDGVTVKKLMVAQ